jgi:hypothetical protein
MSTAVPVASASPVPQAPLAPLQLGGLFAGPIGQLLLGLVVLAVVLVVGRVVLNVAWRLVTVAIVVVAVLWLLFTFVL